MSLFSVFILTVLICSLLLLGGAYALPIPADEVTSSNTTEDIMDIINDLIPDLENN